MNGQNFVDENCLRSLWSPTTTNLGKMSTSIRSVVGHKLSTASYQEIFIVKTGGIKDLFFNIFFSDKCLPRSIMYCDHLHLTCLIFRSP